jgi:hypothetical protein
MGDHDTAFLQNAQVVFCCLALFSIFIADFKFNYSRTFCADALYCQTGMFCLRFQHL